MKSLLVFIVMTWTPLVFSADREILKEGSFIDAVERENVVLLRERIQIRLKGPFPEFVDELFYLTDTGGNIFHALAGVKTNQEEFSKTLEALINIFSIGIHERVLELESVTLGEMTIHFRKDLKNTLLFQTVQTGNLEKINREMENIFEKGTALSALTYLHGHVEQAVLFPPYPGSKYHPPLIPDMSEMKLSHLKKMAELPPPYLKTDYNGFSPKQIAEQSTNLPAFDVLTAAPDYSALDKMGRHFIIGSVLGFVGVFLTGAIYFEDAGAGTVFGGVAAPIAGGIGIFFPECLHVFKRGAIKRKLKKTNISMKYSSAG